MGSRRTATECSPGRLPPVLPLRLSRILFRVHSWFLFASIRGPFFAFFRGYFKPAFPLSAIREALPSTFHFSPLTFHLVPFTPYALRNSLHEYITDWDQKDPDHRRKGHTEYDG